MTRYEKTTRYIESVLQDMDWNTMYKTLYDSMLYELKDSTDEQIDEMYNYHFEDDDEEATTTTAD
tara:strand:+ start:1121 stop:1315 length:195 start_codon:yes stop_codon:yes gene_type:complete